MLPSTVSAADFAITPVVLSGTATTGGTLTAGFGTPVVNASGKVGFYGAMSGGTSGGGIFTATPGSLQSVARLGVASPGGGGFYGGFVGATYINDAGDVAYIANLSGGTSTQGYFATSGGVAGAVALINSPSPSGGNYSVLGVPITFNPSGRVGYAAYTNSNSVQGIYSGVPGSATTIAVTPQAAPSGGIITAIALPAINASGQMVFGTAISNGPYIGGIHVGNGATLQPVALIGAAAPGGGNHGPSFTSTPTINNAGQVAFFNSLTNTSAAHAIFVGTPGSVAPVARQGEATPAGGTYSALSTLPVINAAGQVAFRGDITGGSSARGIFLGTSTTVQTIALIGDPSPDGVGVISTFATVNSALSLNATGQVAFTATLGGAGVTTANDGALLIGTPGDLSLVVREGDVVDVDSSAGVDLRTVSAIGFGSGSGGEDGRNVTLTANGIITYRLTFTDNTAGIFTSTVSAVPEPASLSLLALGGAAMLRRKQRN